MASENEPQYDSNRLTAIHDEILRQQIYIATKEDLVNFAIEIDTDTKVASLAFGSLCRAVRSQGHTHIGRGLTIEDASPHHAIGLRVVSFPYLLDMIERKEVGEKTPLDSFATKSGNFFKDFNRAVLL